MYLIFFLNHRAVPHCVWLAICELARLLSNVFLSLPHFNLFNFLVLWTVSWTSMTCVLPAMATFEVRAHVFTPCFGWGPCLCLHCSTYCFFSRHTTNRLVNFHFAHQIFNQSFFCVLSLYRLLAFFPFPSTRASLSCFSYSSRFCSSSSV